MGGQAIEAVINAADRDRDHFALKLAQPALGQHQIVVQSHKTAQLFLIMGVSEQDIGHKPQLFVTNIEIFLEVG